MCFQAIWLSIDSSHTLCWSKLEFSPFPLPSLLPPRMDGCWGAFGGIFRSCESSFLELSIASVKAADCRRRWIKIRTNSSWLLPSKSWAVMSRRFAFTFCGVISVVLEKNRSVKIYIKLLVYISLIFKKTLMNQILIEYYRSNIFRFFFTVACTMCPPSRWSCLSKWFTQI